MLYHASRNYIQIDVIRAASQVRSTYIANILEQRERITPQPGALHLTRRQDLLELDVPEPNLSVYETDDTPQQENSPDEHEEDNQ